MRRQADLQPRRLNNDNLRRRLGLFFVRIQRDAKQQPQIHHRYDLAAHVDYAEQVLRALKDKSEYMRLAAARALGRIGDVRAVEPLIKSAKDKSALVRLAAVDALGRIGDVRAAVVLASAAKKDRSMSVRLSAARALRGKSPD